MAELLSRFRVKTFFLLTIVTLLASGCGGEGEAPIVVVPPGNNAPTISSATTDTAPTGAAYTYTIIASDADGDAVTFKASLLPSWLTFNAASGTLSGTPSSSNVGDYSVTLVASDGMDSTPLFLMINVYVPNLAPVITSKAAKNAVVGSAYSYTLMATDVDTLAMSLVSTLPSWATFDAASGKLSGTPAAVGEHKVELSVSDGTLSTNQKFTLIVTSVPSVVVGFDETTVFSSFGGAVADVVNNPDSTGISNSAKVGRMQKFAGETYGGTTVSLADPISLTPSPLFGQNRNAALANGKIIAANNVFTLKVWSQRQVALTFKLEGDVDANDVERVVSHAGTGWETLSFDFSGVTGTGYTAITLIFDNGVAGDAAGDAANWTFYFDDMVVPFVAEGGTTIGPDITLNGGFDDGLVNWNDVGAIVLEGTNNIFQADVQAAGNPWDVSLNQVVSLEADKDYILTFKAKASVARTIVAGLGLNYDPWTNAVETINLTTEWVTYTLNLTTTGFGDANNRIIFDMGAAVGVVSIDDVTVTLASVPVTGGSTVGPEITLNGDFEDGLANWNDVGAIVLEGTNNIFQADVQAAGNPWDVSLNQVIALEADSDYILTFKAKASVARSIVAGIGLNYDPWTNAAETVNLTTEWVTYTLNLTTTGFGDANNRIIFDMGAEIGVVSLDDVSLTLASVETGGGDTGGGDTGGGDTGGGDTGGGETAGPEITVNGGFENAYEGWNEIGAIVLVGDNHIFEADVQAAGNSHDVNLSQVITLEANTDYILTFKAKASVARTIIAGLGLNYDPWTNAVETVNLTTEWVTYTLNLTTTGFGDANNRIIFDMGAEIGVVSLDDVSVTLANADTGSGNTTVDAIDFENAVDSYTFSDFDGGQATVVANPYASGINTSAQVGKMLKFAGQPWGGSTLALAAPIDVADGSVFTLKVWSERVVAVLFKLEGMNKERSVSHGGTGWEELSFDFTGDSGTGVPSITLIFDLGVMGDADNNLADWTFYFDDMTFPGAADNGGETVTKTEIFYDDALATGLGFDMFNPDGAISHDAAVVESGRGNVIQVVKTGNTGNFYIVGPDGGFDLSSWQATGDLVFDLNVSSLDAGVQLYVKFDSGWPNVSDYSVTLPTTGEWAEIRIPVADILANGNTFGDGTADVNNLVNVFVVEPTGVMTFKLDNIRLEDAGTSGGDTGGGDTGGGETAGIVSDFEGAAGSYMFSDFDGGQATIVANPHASGINTSAQVGQMIKFAGQPWGGSTLTLDAPIDVADGSVFTLKVWSDRVVAVLFKLEGMNKERSVNHGGTGWEELSFDFTGDSGTGVPSITLIFDLGVMGDADNNPADWTFYFDDITVPAAADNGGGGDTGGTASGLNTVDFESDGAGAAYTWAVFENDDNPALEVVANPDTSGANTSATVAKFTARQTGNPYAGVESAHGDFGPLTIDASNSIVKIMVWKSVISDVGIKFAIANGGAQGEIKVANTKVNEWEELTFDFTGNIGKAESINIDQIIIFPDFNARSADTVSYFDNISFYGQGEATGSTSGSSIDFEAAADSYTFSDFDGGQATIVANPDATGINTSVQVGKMIKFAGQPWGGSTLALDKAIDVADGTTFTLKVWSDRVVAVLFKLEVMNKERSVSHGGTGWEELSFDFSGDSGTGVTGITLIFDLGVMGDADNTPGDWTFYFDDMTLGMVGTGGSSGSGLSAIDFETGGAGAAYTWAVFENDDNPALEIVANPDMTGANTSATVAKFTARQTGNPWAGVESAHGDFGPLTIDASNKIVKIMVWKSVISDVGIKFAIANGGAQPEIKVANTKVNEWEELTFDLTANIGKAESINIDQIIIFPDFNARSAETVSYFDNITFSN